MKKITIMLLLVLISINGFSQNEVFVYINKSYGVEIKFPAKPVISDYTNSKDQKPNATLNLPIDGGLAYQILFQKNIILVSYISIFKNMGGYIKSSCA
ncbi:MAG: hypothetical protein A2W99_15035 [Bacteroidetes bacterium GWF2_33_16]|nr:MAG: hypothetical protein A2X00_00050 [Bacteroidetes bacterium GWE2_32_14]OFY07640.1 MAG: hypothetical protein A2W99_15035 [Bacteroidetes bacterium GWF2_33_16]